MNIKKRRTEETKSKRVSSSFKPSLYEKFQKVAYIQSKSPNDLLGILMEDYVNKHLNDIYQYDKMFPDED